MELSLFNVRNRQKMVRQGIFIEKALCYNIKYKIGESRLKLLLGGDTIMHYQKPVVEIVMLNTNDIITSSTNDNVGAGSSDWAGWSDVNEGSIWEE